MQTKTPVLVGMAGISLASKSLAEKVYDVLESGILSMQYTPGTVMNEYDLAASLNISRSPVREALLRLEHIGLVKKSGKARVVSAITPEDILHDYELWEMVEPFCAGLACSTASDEQRGAIEGVLVEMDRFTQWDQINVYRELNLRFHALLVAPCVNKPMVEYHNMVMKYIRWGSNYSLSMAEDSGYSNTSHHEIYQAYCKCDRNQVETLLRTHISKASQRIQQKIINA